MEKLLITGSTGFVGRYVTKKALEKDYEVHLIVRQPSKVKSLFGETVTAYKLDDFTKKDELKKIINAVSPDYVIHLIGIIQENRAKGITFEKIHYEYSKTLYEILKKTPPKKIIHMSALGVDEMAPSKYHITKLKAEKELLKTGIPSVIFRPSFIVGPEQKLFATLKPLLRKVPFLVFPDIGKYYFQPVDVRDVAECFIEAIKHESTGIFELCGDRKVMFTELLRDFVNILGKKIFFVPFPKSLLKIFAQQQFLMMWKDNICGFSSDAESNTVQIFCKREPVSYQDSIRWAAA